MGTRDDRAAWIRVEDMQKSFLERQSADARINGDWEVSLPEHKSTCPGRHVTEDLGIRRVLSSAHRQHRDIPSVWRLVISPDSAGSSHGSNDIQDSETCDLPLMTGHEVHEGAAGVKSFNEGDAETLQPAAAVVWPRSRHVGTTESRSFVRSKGVGDPRMPSERLMSWQAQIAMEQALHPRDRFSVMWRQPADDTFSNGSRRPIVTWCKI